MNTHVCEKRNACRVPDDFWLCGTCFRKVNPGASNEFCPDPLPLEPGGPGYSEQPSREDAADKAGEQLAPAPEGVSLRDYFAAKALQGMLACAHQPQSDEHMFARDAFMLADAMLKARAKDMPA